MIKTNWDNNHLQFCRVIAELASIAIPTDVLDDLADAMDLSSSELNELMNRAQLEWSRASRGFYTVRKYTPKKELREFTNE